MAAVSDKEVVLDVAAAADGSAAASGEEEGKFDVPPPTDRLVTPLLTDMYQISMSYAYFAAGRHNDHAVFDLFFRKNPFKGEFTIFAGLEEVLRLIANFSFEADDLDYLRELLPEGTDPAFFEWLGELDCSALKVYAVHEGSVVFPRIPLLRLEGPLALVQLLETPLLNLVNYASLMATNAARFRIAAGADKTLLEFGLRRAQGPDGAMSASRYSYLGGFDATSNVLAGKLFGIGVKGTHAHSFVSSFTGLEDVRDRMLDGVDLVELCISLRREAGWTGTNMSELAAFISYALAFPSGFLALVDTYDTLHSGVRNFLIVALALHRLGYRAIGIRLDSGDLAYLSREARRMFEEAGDAHDVPYFASMNIVASNGINEAILQSLNDQGHSIDTFGIGTNLVTCQAQPALGMVFKLVEVNERPRIKLSQEIVKVTIPGRKEAFRLLDKTGVPMMDIMLRVGEAPPTVGARMLARHPFDDKKRAYVKPSEVQKLHELVWDGAAGGMQVALPSLEELRSYATAQLAIMREDHMRPLNPTPYKVSVSGELHSFLHELWLKEMPISELS